MITRAIGIHDFEGYEWKTHELTNLKKENMLMFLKERLRDTGEVDERLNQKIYINFLGLKCILMFKDGKKEVSSFNHVYKNNRIYLSTSDGHIPLSKVRNLKKILFLDDLIYHPEYRHLWTERNTFNFKEHFETSGDFLKIIANGWN